MTVFDVLICASPRWLQGTIFITRVSRLAHMHTLIVKLKETQSKGKAYLSASLVIVDEAGYLPVESREAYLFIQFISYRYEKSSTILTLWHCPVFGEYLSLNVYQCLYII